MNINLNDLAITSIETITAFDVVTGDFRFMLDELQTATISQGQEKTDITGKQGRKLNSLKRNKTLTISGTNGLVSAGLLELQTGTKFAQKNTEVKWTDYLTVKSNAATTTFKAVGTAGNEIEKIYVKNANGTLGDAFVQAASVDEGKFTYDPATKAIAFNTGDLADNTEIVVFYNRKINANVHENMSDKYSEKATLYVDAFAEDTCANIYRVQIYMPIADFEGNFDMQMGDSQTVHAFEAESLAGSACNGGASGALWTYTVFGANQGDAA